MPKNLISYWKFNETNDGSYTYFTDSINSTLITTPTAYALTDVVLMRETYLKFCPEG